MMSGMHFDPRDPEICGAESKSLKVTRDERCPSGREMSCERGECRESTRYRPSVRPDSRLVTGRARLACRIGNLNDRLISSASDERPSRMRIAVIAGDGIGKDVTAEAVKVLDRDG